MFNTECDYNKCCEYDRYIMDRYPYVNRFELTKSAVGRPIFGYNAGAENGIIMCGAFHGMEHITSAMLYKFIDDVFSRMEKSQRIKSCVKSKGITIIPMINPDGVQISIYGANTAGAYQKNVQQILNKEHKPHTKWQANARGVDINHNFDADFLDVKKHEINHNITAPSSTRYGGEYPESECETKALCDLCRKNNYKMCVALHSQGREIYYDFSTHTIKNSLCVAKKLSHLSGYKVSHPQTMAVGGGFKDWFIKEFHKMGFTIEVGLGENPLPPEIFQSEYPLVFRMLWYLLLFG